MAKEQRREHACSKYKGDGGQCRRCGATLGAHEDRIARDYSHRQRDTSSWADLRDQIREVMSQ